MGYEFIIFGSNYDYDKIIFGSKNENIKYLGYLEEIKNPVLKYLFKIHYSKKINKIFNLPFKRLWNKIYLKKLYNYSPKYFIFFTSRIYLREMGFFKKLKELYPGSKLIMYCRDLIETYPDFDIEYYKKNFDLVLTFDALEADKYNIINSPPVYSKLSLKENNHKKRSDLVFVGYAKNRLDTLINIYEFMTNKGKKCDFTILGVPEELQKYKDKINYTKSLTYIEVIEKIKRTKCILEIVQKNSTGYTLRVMESIFYDKKLITNNSMIKQSDYYDDNLIKIIDSLEEFDFNFLDDNEYKFDEKLKERFSMENWLAFIEDKLKEN